MEMLVLGPVRLVASGRPVALAPKVRALLAILAIHANRTVSVDRLIDSLWGEEPPPTAGKTLQTYVFLVRRELAVNGDEHTSPLRIVTEGQGYRLEVSPLALDAGRFEHLLGDGRSKLDEDPLAASHDIAAALALWHGPPYVDFAYEPWAEGEIERLEELRGSAYELLAEARLALGEYQQVIGDLRQAVAEMPFRERLWANLMLALYRSGRRAESLLAFRDAEEALRTELGAEPGPELQELAARVRQGDRALSPRASPPRGQIVHADVDDATPPASSLPFGRPLDPFHQTRTGRRLRDAGRPWVLGAAMAVATVAMVGVLLGVRLLFGAAARPPALTGPDLELQRRLPLAVRDLCARDVRDAPSLGLESGFRCELPRGSAANWVEYWQFTTPEQFHIAVDSIVDAHHLEEGDCAREPAAVGTWEVGNLHQGRILCYPADGGSWEAWTYEEDRILARAFRNDAGWQQLHAWATQLARFLRA